ncbi:MULTISPECIES: hypothetical protein [Acinetobacter]|uniref:hypothetical protein n=1 Tax=Acinetobacter TaxID=469 RepID=UPI0022E856A1|nr:MULTISPECIES: hypothetical protein [Acinetobacter]MDI1225231.1 hypothetical protein [Acinetobacter sp.]
MNNLVCFSTWIEKNSGQIQIVIGILAFVVAVIALKKILHQIKISSIQTQLTIDQIESLNKERLFDLRLRLTTRIGEHFKTLRELQDANSAASLKLYVFLIEIENNHRGSLDAMKSVDKLHREQIVSYSGLIGVKFQETQDLQNSLDKNIDIQFIENVLMEVEQNQIKYDSMWDGIKNIEKSIDDLWRPLKTGDIMKAEKIKYNLE